MLAVDPLPSKAGEAYQALRREFADAGIQAPELEASILMEWATGFDRLALLTYPDNLLPDLELQQLTAARDERLSGKPVHRIIGRREFFGLEFELSEGTLEPRPDSECVVELALKAVDARQGESLSILDLGTGTGILAVSLLSRMPNAKAVAVDASADALSTATKNAELNRVAARFQTLQSDWFEKVQGKFDLIISNPPYIKTADISGLSPEVREHDPMLALDGGADGLATYRLIASRAGHFLLNGGLVVLEIGHDQCESVTSIFESSGFRLARRVNDLGGNDRGLLFISQP
jgi:release factor glutamine methyltransferase